jgi:hypothetical protein
LLHKSLPAPGDLQRELVRTTQKINVRQRSLVAPLSERRKIPVFIGTGFLGRRVVDRLLDRDLTTRIAARYPEQTRSTATVGNWKQSGLTSTTKSRSTVPLQMRLQSSIGQPLRRAKTEYVLVCTCRGGIATRAMLTSHGRCPFRVYVRYWSQRGFLVFVGCRNWYADQTGTPVLWPLPQDAHEEFFSNVDRDDFESKIQSPSRRVSEDGIGQFLKNCEHDYMNTRISTWRFALASAKF